MESMVQGLQLWVLSHGVPIVLIIFGAWLVRMVLHKAVIRFEKRFKQEGVVPSEIEKRIKTLSGTLHTTLTVIILTIAIMMIITELGVEIGPLLAGVGIAGLAVGFGAQSLVKDVINGFFILVENQVRIGDVVNVAGIGGLVEAINLRTTRLRDLEGRVHIIPNGSIEIATNFTKEWSRALVEIGVAYKEDIDHVTEVMQKVGEDMRNDPAFSEVILEPMTVLGLDSFGDSSLNIRAFFKTIPLKQWEVAREFRKRLKKAFDEARIEIPFPHRTIYIGEAESEARLKIDAAIHNAKP